MVTHYTPPALRDKLGLLAQFNPIQGMADSMSQFGVATDPSRSMDDRRKAAINTVVEGLLATAPAAVASRGYMTPAQGMMEGLLGGSPATQQIGDDLGRFVASEAGSIGVDPIVRRGDDILARLKTDPSSVTDEMLDMGDAVSNTRLNQYLFDHYDLPMDEASRMARAREMGFGGDLYHGTTHDFPSFGGATRNIEGHYGAGDYFTSSAEDASKNYAGFGPDLTQRIALRAERLADDLGLDYDDPAIVDMARKELAGGHEGAIIPSMVRGQEVSVVPHTRGSPTILERDYPYSYREFLSDAKGDLGEGADQWDIQELAQEMADEANAYEEPVGPLADIMRFISERADDYNFDPSEGLGDVAYEDAIAASDLDRALRQATVYAEHPETGELAGNDLIRQAYASAGFPNIRMSADAAGWNMDIPEGTSHLISSDPANIRSRFARFDPRLSHLKNLSGSVPTASIPLYSAGLLGGGYLLESGEE